MSAGKKIQYLHLKRPGKKPEKVAFDQELKSGGAGTVYSVKDNPELVIKCYHSSVLDSEGEIYREKIECMLSRVPKISDIQTGNGSVVQLAWPVASAYTLKGAFVGFAMPTIDFQRTAELEYALQEKQAKQHGLRHDLGARILLAHNLASVVSSIHAQEHAIVDLKPVNLKFYKEELFVAVLDCDGFFIKTPGKEGKAPQVTADYLAPEFQGAPVKNPEHQDRFALAAIIFQLLNYGTHPFTGVPNLGEDVPAEREARIKGGLYPYGNIPHKKVRPHPGSVHEAFPQELRELFDRAFSYRPTLRPSSAEWVSVLNKYADKSKKLIGHCPRGHLQFSGMPCLSCLREQILIDATSGNGPKQVPGKTSHAAATPVRHAAPQPQMVTASSSGNLQQAVSPSQHAQSQAPLQRGLPTPTTGWFDQQNAAVALMVFAVVVILMWFTNMVKNHFETSRINGRQPVLVAAQQENTKQKFPQEAAPQPATAPDAAIDISTEQVDSTGDSLSIEESVNSDGLTIESDSVIEPGQPIPDQSVAIEPPRIQDSVAENEKTPSPPILSTQGGGSQTLPPEQGFESGKKSDPNNEVVNSVARNDGAVTHEPSGWIGVGYKPLSPQVIHSMGLAYGQGILISDVHDAGPAARAGVAVGDILISVDGKNVGAENAKEVISGLPVGKMVRIEVIRNDTRRLLTVRMEPRP